MEESMCRKRIVRVCTGSSPLLTNRHPATAAYPSCNMPPPQPSALPVARRRSSGEVGC
jgi:hypothetical protein